MRIYKVSMVSISRDIDGWVLQDMFFVCQVNTGGLQRCLQACFSIMALSELHEINAPAYTLTNKELETWSLQQTTGSYTQQDVNSTSICDVFVGCFDPYVTAELDGSGDSWISACSWVNWSESHHTQEVHG